MQIWITGANRGLGFSLTEAGVQRGHTVYAGVRNAEQAEGLKQLGSRYPGKVKLIVLNVKSEESIADAAEQLKQQNVSLDAIINNAAILLGRSAKIEELQLGELQESFTVNLFGPMLVMKHFLPLVARKSGSTLVNISSEAGSTAGAYGGDYPYALSKAALNYFSLQLKQYLKDDDVRVLAVHPGWIKTDMGGAAAPGSPVDAAGGIWDMIERKTAIGSAVFVDHTGKPMQL